MEFHHLSVLLKETVENLPKRKNGIFVDGTMGGGGHTAHLCAHVGPTARIIGIDQDENAILAAQKRLAPYTSQCTFVRDNFKNITAILSRLEVEAIDGAILDLGVSSHQLDEGARGFSYQTDAPLDMRMDQRSTFTAAELVNTFSEEAVAKIIFDYGEERFARRIASCIVTARAQKPIETTGELVTIIKKAIPLAKRQDGPHPAKRTFQAIRIAVNDELGLLKGAVEDFVKALTPGGRVSIITFHSLEDRIVKKTFQAMAESCTCPKSFPICVCGGQAWGKIISRKPITSSEKELEENPRARSAKLRIFERI